MSSYTWAQCDVVWNISLALHIGSSSPSQNLAYLLGKVETRHPSQEQDSGGDTEEVSALGIRHIPEHSLRTGSTWAKVWAQLSRVHGQIGHGCGGWRPALLQLHWAHQHQLTPPGADVVFGVWAVGRRHWTGTLCPSTALEALTKLSLQAISLFR